jgi:hypothetical protein
VTTMVVVGADATSTDGSRGRIAASTDDYYLIATDYSGSLVGDGYIPSKNVLPGFTRGGVMGKLDHLINWRSTKGGGKRVPSYWKMSQSLQSIMGYRKKPAIGSTGLSTYGTDANKLKADLCRLTEGQFDQVMQKDLNKVIAAQILNRRNWNSTWENEEPYLIYFLGSGDYMEIKFDELLYFKTIGELQYIRFLLQTDLYLKPNRCKAHRLESLDMRMRNLAMRDRRKQQEMRSSGFILKHINSDGSEEPFQKVAIQEETGVLGSHVKFLPASGSTSIARPEDLTKDVIDLIDLRALLYQTEIKGKFQLDLKESVIRSIIRQERRLLDSFLKNRDNYRKLPED